MNGTSTSNRTRRGFPSGVGGVVPPPPGSTTVVPPAPPPGGVTTVGPPVPGWATPVCPPPPVIQQRVAMDSSDALRASVGDYLGHTLTPVTQSILKWGLRACCARLHANGWESCTPDAGGAWGCAGSGAQRDSADLLREVIRGTVASVGWVVAVVCKRQPPADTPCCVCSPPGLLRTY